MKKEEQNSKKKDNAALGALSNKYPKGYLFRRVVAAVVDLFVVTMLCQLAFILFGEPDWAKYTQMQEVVAGLPVTDPLVVERTQLYQRCFIITLLIGAAYESLFMMLFKASLGKLIFRMRVVDQKPDRNFFLSKLMLIVRAVLKSFSIYLLSAIPFVFLCLSIFGNDKGRSGFDSAVGTQVIDLRHKENDESSELDKAAKDKLSGIDKDTFSEDTKVQKGSKESKGSVYDT